MSITTTLGDLMYGRFGNQFIRNLALNFIAEKHNLKVNYFNYELIKKLGINLFSGNNVHNNMINLDDSNYFTILNSNNLENNLNANHAYFQNKEITNNINDYLHSEQIKTNIINHNNFKERYNNNNDLYIHIRLDDARRFNPGINFYIKTLNLINFDNLYISTDEKDHVIIKTLLKLYPKATLLNYDEVNTIQFASTCKHIILSNGTFSAIIGYFSFFSTVYYPEIQTVWHGDIFSIKDWVKIKVN